jgi:fluoride exporter
VQNLALISIFGVIGILSRFGIDRLFFKWNEQFPISTLLINLIGSFIAGAVYAFNENRQLPEGLQLALLVGFCGGFTTFSAYTLQTLMMLERGRFLPAFMYAIASPALALIMAFVSVVVVRKLV